MRPDLTSAEIARSGSYFDDLRDPRRYGFENTTGRVRGGATSVSAARRRVRPNPLCVLVPSLDGKHANR